MSEQQNILDGKYVECINCHSNRLEPYTNQGQRGLICRECNHWDHASTYQQLVEKNDRLLQSIENEERIEQALEIAGGFGGIDGAHHKDWVIDQIVRILTGEEYNQWVTDICDGEDGPNTYEWDTGIAP